MLILQAPLLEMTMMLTVLLMWRLLGCSSWWKLCWGGCACDRALAGQPAALTAGPAAAAAAARLSVVAAAQPQTRSPFCST